MHILLAAAGFTIVGLLGLLRIILPLGAIDRPPEAGSLRILCSMVALGAGIDDAANEKLRRIPNAESMLKHMIARTPTPNSTPEMVLQMLRARCSVRPMKRN